MLKDINIEDNKGTSMQWLTELNVSSRMEMLCIESLKETQTIYDYSYCGKVKMLEANDLCKNGLMKGY